MAEYIGVRLRKHSKGNKAKITIVDLTTGIDVIRDKIVDLYSAAITYNANGENLDPSVVEFYDFWQKVNDASHKYGLYVYNIGAGEYGSGAPTDGMVQVECFLKTTTLNPAQPAASLLLLWQNERPHMHQFSNINVRTKTEVTKYQTFLADGARTSFQLSDENTASDFHSFSDDGGATWKSIYDLSITWGSNDPDYNDEQIDINGFFAIKFFSAPISGSTVIIKYYPAANRARLYTIFNLAQDDTFIDYKTPSRLMQYALELFK